MSRIETENELKQFTGMEYALVHAQPPLFVIQQRHRLSPTEVRPTAVYFILNNVLYSGPDLYTLLSTKLTNALNMIQGSLDILRAARPDYTPRIGHVWPIIDEPTNKTGTSKAQQPARQGSLVPGTPMDISGGSQPIKGHDPSQMGTKRDGAGAHGNEGAGTTEEENEMNQIWDPFAVALQSLRFDMEKKRHAAIQAAEQQQQLVGASGSGSSFAAAAGAGGIGPLSTTGAPTTGLGDDARAGIGAGTRSTTLGPDARSSLVTGPLGSTTSGGGGQIPGGSGAARFTVPTADGPSSSARLKGVPGPPGKPGQGKKNNVVSSLVLIGMNTRICVIDCQTAS
ncbi:hypothetical protein PIIN_00646 [Serendipita indica DSM 11827]|uniref:Mediator of RNA polymerase II transcription subunit 6 n=1 Tax=Serendipita indica (strain DSM 11827) TaxID=1109443 RepID=G4U335_SERID|nr:hypothetical protein PIIN_00646 [Serendipita indica DSM 11827]